MRYAELCLFHSELSHRKRREAILMIMVLMKNHCVLLSRYSDTHVSAPTVKACFTHLGGQASNVHPPASLCADQ
jgi:hypothetical protein